MRNPVTGKNEIVENMNFADWRKKYVENSPKALANEKMLKNKSADQKQYSKYKALLDENVPNSFAKFQEMKYNGGNEYEDLKKSFRTKKHLQKQLAYIYNGESQFIPQNAIIRNAKAIAGKGTDIAIRVEDGLLKAYGGEAGQWTKYVGKIESDKYIFDVHWYELNKTQYKTKLKYRKERKT